MFEGQERRRSMLTDDDRLALVDALSEVMNRRVQDHTAHHEWIEAQIRKDTARAEFWDRLREHLIKWGAVSLVTLVFYLMWQGFKHYVK